MLLQEPKYGDVVYCEENCQVYMVEGWNFSHTKLHLKNLCNLESHNVEIPPSQLRDFPDNWGTKSYYEELAKNIVDKRS